MRDRFYDIEEQRYDIPDSEWYRISDYGRVMSSRWRILKNNMGCKNKIYEVCCLRKNNQNKWYKVHRLVALAFIPNHENKPHINHKDWDKFNNKKENLEWCTPSYNNIHKFEVLWYKNIMHWDKNPSKWKFWSDNKDAVRVGQYNKQWHLIKEWGSIIEATKALWLCKWLISAVCSWYKYNHTTWWYIWKYL